MFGRRNPRPAKEAMFSGWLEKDVRFLAKRFTSELAHLACEISGIEHSTQFCGEAFTSAVRISVIAHPTRVIGSTGVLAASTRRTVSSTDAPLAFAVLTTERKAA